MIYYCIFNKTKGTYYSGGSYGGRFGKVIKLYSQERFAKAAMKSFQWDFKVLGYAAHGGAEPKDELVIKQAKIAVLERDSW